MDKTTLIASATRLLPPSAHSAAEFAEKRDAVTATLNELMARRPDLVSLIGPDNLAMMQNNHHNQSRFMETLLASYNPEVLVETVLWVFRTYRAHGFQLSYWPAQLDTWVGVLREHLSREAFDEIYPFFHWMIVHQAVFARLTGPQDVYEKDSNPPKF